MLNKIIHFSLNNRLLVLVVALIVFVAGIYCAYTTEVDVFPDLNAPTVVVMTEANGMAPEEVERSVTFPIETAVNGATDVRRVRSTSTMGFSCVWVEFEWGTDVYRARQIVTERLAEVSASLPDNIGRPTLGPQSSILGEVMIIGLTADTTSLQHLRTLADWSIRKRLLAVGGVAQVSVQGGEVKEYQVAVHPERMKHHGVTVDEVVDAVSDMNRSVSGGVLYEHGNEYVIRGVLNTNNTDELGQTVVKNVDGSPVLLNQVADIRIGNKSPKTGVASNNAKPAVLLTIARQPNVSSIELTERLDEAIEDIRSSLPADVRIDKDIFRQTRFIDASIGNIRESLIEGALFVVLVLFVFLMNVRTTVISLVTIPLALLVSILTLRCFGLTINTMSIGGMAIAIGSLVDDAIVDVENVYKRLRVWKPSDGSVLDIIYNASLEVRMPILNSTFIIVVSFVPLFFLDGMEGRMLMPLGVAFIVSLFASTIVALTLTPVLCSYFLKPGKGQIMVEPHFVRVLKTYYERALEWSFVHRRGVLGSTFAVFVVTLILFFTLGSSFLPTFNEGSYTISISTLPGISLEESDKIGRKAEELLMTIPEIQTVARKTGRAELDEHAFGVNTSEIEAPFVLDGRSRAELTRDVREKLSSLPGVSIEIGQPISHRIDAMLSGTRANVAIKLFGNDLNRMYRVAGRIREAIEDVDGVVDLKVEQQVERPQIRITPRRGLMAKYGITPRQFADYVSVLLDGKVVSSVYEGSVAFDLTVKLDDEDRRSIEDIRSLMVDAGDSKIPLEYIANIESTSGPNSISRENVSRKIVVSANVEGRDLRSTVNEIKRTIADKVDLPEECHVEYGGQFESAENASRILLITSLLSVIVIFVLLYGQFRNATQSAIVLLNLPLALIGGVMALVVTGGELSIPAIIGFISLFGIATRNGMLLIDQYNGFISKGMDVRVAVLNGSLDRLTPILMTAFTSALALVPLAVGSELPGNEIQSPMAKVMLGGLVSSTLLNIFVIPLIYRKK